MIWPKAAENARQSAAGAGGSGTGEAARSGWASTDPPRKRASGQAGAPMVGRRYLCGSARPEVVVSGLPFVSGAQK